MRRRTARRVRPLPRECAAWAFATQSSENEGSENRRAGKRGPEKKKTRNKNKVANLPNGRPNASTALNMLSGSSSNKLHGYVRGHPGEFDSWAQWRRDPGGAMTRGIAISEKARADPLPPRSHRRAGHSRRCPGGYPTFARHSGGDFVEASSMARGA